MRLQDIVTTAFQEKFGEAPQYVVRAPGRVNLIGEHTDYNDGFVLPMAINRAIWIAIGAVDTPSVELISLDFDEPIGFDLNDYTKGSATPAEYVKGVAWALQEAHYELKGWRGVLKGDVPIGAGLSSSAALELAVARAFSLVNDFEWNPATIAQLAQKAENQWVGMNSGIMDQMISAAGQADHALLIDCRSLETEALRLPPDTTVVILDTGTRRELVTSAYNERRQQCEAAAAHFAVPALRDVNFETFEAQKTGLDAVTMRRARHVITENARVLQAKDALKAGAAAALGKLFNASHVSMRDDFEISSEALNAIVEAAQSHPFCYGARMTGGGFAGCAVAIIQSNAVDDFVQHVEQRYAKTTPHQAEIYVSEATNGAEQII